MVQEKNNVFILENLYNVRHLGDIKTLNGEVTKKYKYIRGSAKGSLNDEEKAHFYNLGTRVIVDLRYTNEITKSPSPLRDYEDTKYYHVDMMGEFWQMREKGYADLSDLYIDLLDDSQAKIKEVFKIFINHKDEGIYFHCTAGKDRTGIIVMLMLSLINVPHQVIVDNYSESYEHNRHRPGYKFMKEEWIRFTWSKPEYIEKAIKHLNDKYGGSLKYLEHIGLTNEEINTLKASLLQ